MHAHRAALPDPDRAAARRHYAATERSRAARALRRAGALGRDAANRFSGRTSPRWCRASPARPRSICRCRAPTTSRSPPPSTSTRSTTAKSRCCLLFSGTVFTQEAGPASASSQVAWDNDATYRLPVRVWRELMDPYFPGSGWLRLQRETLDALHAVQGATGTDDLGQTRSTRCSSQTAGGPAVTLRTRPQDRRRGALRGLRPLPLPRLGRARTSCAGSSGSLAPRAWSEAGGCEPWAMQTECLVGRRRAGAPDRRLRAFLHAAGTAHRGRARRRGSAPVESLDGRRRRCGRPGTRPSSATVDFAGRDLGSAAAGERMIPFEFPAGRDGEAIRGRRRGPIGRFVRERQAASPASSRLAARAGRRARRLPASACGVENLTAGR